MGACATNPAKHYRRLLARTGVDALVASDPREDLSVGDRARSVLSIVFHPIDAAKKEVVVDRPKFAVDSRQVPRDAPLENGLYIQLRLEEVVP